MEKENELIFAEKLKLQKKLQEESMSESVEFNYEDAPEQEESLHYRHQKEIQRQADPNAKSSKSRIIAQTQIEADNNIFNYSDDLIKRSDRIIGMHDAIFLGKLQNTNVIKESKPKQVQPMPRDIYKIEEEDSDIETLSKYVNDTNIFVLSFKYRNEFNS